LEHESAWVDSVCYWRNVVTDMKQQLTLEEAFEKVIEICGTEVGAIERSIVERLEIIEAKLGIKHVDVIDWKKVKHK